MLGASTASGALAAALVVTHALPGTARANGDPASHVLLRDDVFLPLQPKPSPTAATAVKVLLRRTRAGGYPLHIAVIASGGDLGDVPQYFGRPQQYADLLYSEIDFQEGLMGAGFTLQSPHYTQAQAGGCCGGSGGSGCGCQH